MKHGLRTVQRGFALVAILLAVLWPVKIAAAPPTLTPDDLRAFFAPVIAKGMATHNLPGVTLAVVRVGTDANNAMVFTQGYGYADLERGIAVDAAATLFDVGSVSKLFTFTAVMQLVEEGRLDLDADVNRYLRRFQVPDTFSEPVTVAHLLTHTAGFDEWDMGAAARTAEEVLPVCVYLARRLPPRVRSPGEIIAYSNHGTALAGCLVAEVTGMPFAQAIEERILAPLGMARSTFLWPPELMADMAVGYRQANGTLQPMDIYYRHYGPAGELKTTAADMARFMLAHLQDGRYDEDASGSASAAHPAPASCARILEPATAQQMHRQQFTHHPRLSGFTYGFFEDEFNGRRALVHGGDTNPIFSSLLVLLPEEGVGLFVAHNTANYAVREELVGAFMDRYFPAEEEWTASEPLPGHAQRAGRFTGLYAPTFMWRESNIEKLLTLTVQFRITADADGFLLLHEPPQLASGPPTRWVEVEPLLFERIDANGVMAFVEDEEGRISYMATSLYPAAAFIPRAWFDAPAFHLVLLGICTLLLGSAVVAWFRRRRANGPLLRHLFAAIGALNLLFLVGVAIALQVLAFDAIFGPPLWLRGLLTLPVITTLLTLVALGFTVRAWRLGAGSQMARLYDTLVLVAAVGFAWQVAYWRLMVVWL
jgi:CubicO group peptidase (beta-lactamase class C family)